MKPSLRVSFLFAMVLGVTASLQAQNQEIPAGNEKAPNTAVVPKPTRNSGWVTTDDPVALLAVREASGAKVAPKEETVKKEGAAGKETTQRAAEMAEVEQQIKDKQTRITLLMRLFVDDEKKFLMDPTNTDAEAAVTERRQYEQNELHWETAELARLKGKLEELRKGGK